MASGATSEQFPAAPSGGPRLEPGAFRRWAELLERRTGIALPPARQSRLASAVALRMARLGLQDQDRYFALVSRGDRGGREWLRLVNHLTVRETRFFRDPAALALLPELAAGLACGRAIDVCSVGCATGEEAYSIAMVLDRARDPGRPPARITGIDISTAAIAVARRGCYPARRAAGIPPVYRERYCLPDDAGGIRLRDELRRQLRFVRRNVLAPGAGPAWQADIICCQNLLIYLGRERRRELAERLADRLRPGGVLILGSGELLHWDNPGMRRLAPGQPVLAYRRVQS